MPEYGTFEGTDVERVPSAYFVPAYLTEAIDRLRTHGITMRALSEPAEMALEEFHIQRTVAAERPFQGRRERTLTGSWVAATREVQAGTLRVDMNQPLARLAFYLIEPRSDDGLANWDLLGAAPGEARVYPISRSVR
jgi:hypothetical protein